MQCRCCQGSVNAEAARCSVCGFPLLGNAAGGLQSVLENYRKKLLTDVSISVRFYYYEYNGDGELTEQKNEYIKVADALSLAPGEVFWFGGLFDAEEVNRDITLDVRVTNGAKEYDSVLTAQAEGGMSFGRLGVYLCEGLQARLAVGDEQQYKLTESIALLHNNANT